MTPDVIAVLTSPPFLVGCVPLLAPLGFYITGEAALQRERRRTGSIAAQIAGLERQVASVRTARMEEAERQEEALARLLAQPDASNDAVSPMPTAPGATQSPLEQTKDQTAAWFEAFGQGLNAWAAAAGAIDPNLFREQRDALSRLRQRLTATASMEDLEDLRHATTEAVVRLLTALISKTDRDLDPEGKSGTLQQALTRVVQTAGLAMTGAVGEEVDTVRHKRTGTVPISGPEKRGTVAAVRTRGLMDSQNRVYALAEIAEFD